MLNILHWSMEKVVHGALGRTIASYTANLYILKRWYILCLWYGKHIRVPDLTIYHGLINIGRNPTADVKIYSVEVYIFYYNNDIYDKNYFIDLLDMIRPEKKCSPEKISWTTW